ncbi:hypothetical protein NHE_0616 [Neorickettsia helminthoeca str. Oregon]|uniref:Uncharacterized protein n=1 Tax=Neorickettsia helminthoeca str. Oregon TaxID=1286528 RepID=X5H4R6_9RICK|nr:hypothetical protein [Neorickettsia helminthoeca]AHX11551.1 hypothetical protein NHE_0616 [Neorickettsia helminthoeca str. Oregon]
MSKIAELLSLDLSSKRIFLFEGQSESVYLAYLREFISLLRNTVSLTVEHTRFKDCSNVMLLEKLQSLSCFGKLFLIYDDHKFPISKVGKIEHFLCLYSTEPFSLKSERSDVLKIAFSKNDATLEDLILYYARKHSIRFEPSAVGIVTKYLRANDFPIEEEIIKLKYYFEDELITAESLSTILDSISPSINELCRSIITLDTQKISSHIKQYSDSEGLLIIRCLMKYCNAVLEIISDTAKGMPKYEIVKRLRKNQFYDLEMIENVSSNHSCGKTAKILLLNLPKIERQYKLHVKGRFTMLQLRLIDLCIEVKSSGDKNLR